MDTIDNFGALLKSLRLKARLSLRAFAKKAADDPANISRMERSLRPAPNDEVSERYAKALDLKQGENEWIHFMDLAAISRRELPKDIASDEELLAKLPVFLRTIRGNRLTEEELQSLKDTIFAAYRP